MFVSRVGSDLRVMEMPCGHSDAVYVEYMPVHPTPKWAWFDGVSEIKCQTCGARYGRWTGRVLADDEYEPRYGGGRSRVHP